MLLFGRQLAMRSLTHACAMALLPLSTTKLARAEMRPSGTVTLSSTRKSARQHTRRHHEAQVAAMTVEECARRARPGRRRGAKEREEGAAVHSHSITPSASARRFAGSSSPRALAVLLLITNSNRTGCITEVGGLLAFEDA